MSDRGRIGALAGFGLLAGYSSLHWFALVADPPLWRWAACLSVALALAIALPAIGRLGGRRTAIAGALLLAAALVVGFAAAGTPLRLLAPGAWGELRTELDTGLSGIHELDLPYAGPSTWTRLGILLAAPLTLAAAAATAFWPRQRRPGLRRGIALTLLVALYAVSVTWESPDAEPAHGLGLLVCIAAFLWLGRLPASRAVAATAAVMVAGLAALPAAARVDSTDPAINYAGWRIFGEAEFASFDWDHSYGPLDWPQRGVELFEASGAQYPLYWKTSVLDEFDGVVWRRGDGVAGVLIEDTDTIALSGASPEMVARHPNWLEEVEVSVLGLRSPLVVTTGTTTDVEGIETQPRAADGTTRVLTEELAAGTSYQVAGYAPNPTAEVLKRRDDGHYPEALERYTTVSLPQATSDTTLSPEAAPVNPLASVTMPIRGSGALDSSAESVIANSPYERVADLAERLTREARGNYQAVVAIERYLLDNYLYDQDVPEHPADPLVGFLYRDRRGYCQQFSGAMALMLRFAGIPSRVVSGFAPGLPDPDAPGTYLVRDTDAHSWVEVWFPRVGWVTVDPTPAAAPARTETTQASGADGVIAATGLGRGFEIEESAQSGPLRGRSPSQGSGEDGSSAGTVMWLALFLAGIGLFYAYRRRRRLLLAPEGAEPQLRELERVMALLGGAPSRGLTLMGIERQFAATLGTRAADYPAALRANRYRRGNPRRPGPHQRRELRSAIARGRGPVGRVRALLALPPGGPRPAKRA